MFQTEEDSSSSFKRAVTSADTQPHQPRWVAVFTVTRHEKRVGEHCEDRQIESFVPLYSEKHRWKNRRTVEVELPLFPNYCFARITAQERLRLATIPGVVSIVSSRREPLPVPDEYIAWLHAGLEARLLKPHCGAAVGDRVSIIGGPFAGMQGVLTKQKNELRVVLTLEMIGRSISVEVGSEEIAPVHFKPPMIEIYSYNAISLC